jgi:hypothetical protein
MSLARGSRGRSPHQAARVLVALAVCLLPLLSLGQRLPLPDRPADAPHGSQFARRVASLDLAAREREIVREIASGNIPSFLRQLRLIEVTNAGHAANYYVTPDYLAIGSENDYFRVPISPNTAQIIADRLNCSLPTRKMVDQIYAAAEVKLKPSPIPPSPAMTTVEVFAAHNETVEGQRKAFLDAHPLGTLVAGHKKDLVITPALAEAAGKVAIYGWHQPGGKPIQPLYLGHAASWVDYSQCTRLVQQAMLVNREPNTVTKVLADPALASLLSDEGVIANPGYPTNALTQISRPAASNPDTNVASINRSAAPPAQSPDSLPNLEAFSVSPFFHERVAFYTNNAGVRVHINAPGNDSFAPGKKVWLILYALPNGNTIEQTVGKTLRPGDDWHFDIQHIGAQTRWLRERFPQKAIAVAYLENTLKSWPSWRKKFGDTPIPRLIEGIEHIFDAYPVELTLTGHSGGGSFIFGYLNAIDAIPSKVTRIAFLDSNYAYNREQGHDQKLAQWLKLSDQNCLCILAYHDSVALLDGKTFVSAAGGTWGRSHEMQKDLSRAFQFTAETNGGFERYFALTNRIEFLLKENPEKKIFHTVQVERNGFIHGMLSGTPKANEGYEYFGPRAYSNWIQPE